MSFKLHYIGHSAFCIETAETCILIDPFISDNPNSKINFDLKKTDYIFLTHAHADHIGDTIELSKQTGAKVYAIHELANYLISKGAYGIGTNLGGKLKFNWGEVKFLPAFHSSSTIDGVYGGCPASLLFKLDDVKLYHAGDNCLNSEFKIIGEIEKPDVAMLPIGGHYTMNQEDAATAAKWLGAYTIIPIHYDTFEPIKTNPTEFINLIEYDNRICKTLKAGEHLEW